MLTAQAPTYVLNRNAYLMPKDGNKKRDFRAVDSERRAHKRLMASLPVMLPTGKAYTKDISAGGVYLELERRLAEQYSIGKNIPIWVHASYGSNFYFSQQLWLFANATVVRKERVPSAVQMDGWGVGLMFSGKLDMTLSTDDGFY